MKKILLIILLFPLIGIAQQTTGVNYRGLQNVVSSINRAALLNNITSLEMNVDISKVSYLKPNDLNKVIDEMIVQDKNEKNKVLSLKYINKIKKYYEDIIGFGDANSEIILVEKTNEPYEFTTFNGSLTFCQSGIFSKSSYNTLKLNSDQRASSVVKDVLLPSLSNFKPLLTIPEIKYFCIIAAYTAKDFSSDSKYDADGETVAIVIPKSTIQKYLASQLTDEQIFKLASFYNVNKNTNGMVKKILVK